MKKLLSILLIGLYLLSFTACSDDDEGGISNTGFPTYIPDPDGDNSITDLGFDYFFTIRKTYDEKYHEVEVLSLKEPDNSSLILNGEDMSFDWDYDEDYFWGFSLESEDLEGIDFSAGSVIDYLLEINNKEFTGELEILDELIVDWPDFNFNENYIFTWNISTAPDIYNVLFFIEDINLLESWQIDGSFNDFTISKSLYEEYADENYDLLIEISAINYINHGKCLAWVETYSHFYEDF